VLADLNPQPFRRQRKAERFRFPSPLPGTLDGIPIVMNDLSAVGAGIVHKSQLPRGFTGSLMFQWECVRIEMQCSVTRTSLERQIEGGIALTIYHSGLLFTPVATETDFQVRAFVAATVSDALQQQKANAYGVSVEMARQIPEVIFEQEESRVVAPSLDLNQFFTPRLNVAELYTHCSLEGERWAITTVDNPEQPAEGFTVSAAEPRSEIDTLCWTYQNADPEGRKLIRTFAHLSVIEPGDTPRDLYLPGR